MAGGYQSGWDHVFVDGWLPSYAYKCIQCHQYPNHSDKNDLHNDGRSNELDYHILVPGGGNVEAVFNVVQSSFSIFQPSDWVKQSLPFSYVSLEASSLDGAAHDIQLYCDISPGKLSLAVLHHSYSRYV